MRISACIIMKDAAEDIADCLESLQDGTDEIIVVDTGSTDDSVEIARRYTDQVYFFAWRDDFAAAKNNCLEYATGDWIVFLDSDEYLTKETRGNLRRAVGEADAQGYDEVEVRRDHVDEDHVPMVDLWDYSVRLFRNDPLRRFRDPIHEHLVCEGREDHVGRLPPDALCIHHTGYAPARLQGKNRRNLEMLERMKAQGQEKDLMDFYLGAMYFDSKEYEKALFHAKEAIDKGALPHVARLGAWRIWYGALRALGRGGEELEAMLKRAMKECPLAPDFYAFYGAILLDRGEYAAAWEHLQKAEQLMEEFSRNYPAEGNSLHRIRGSLYRAMSETCLHLGKKEPAEKYARMDWAAEHVQEDRGFCHLIPPKSRCVVEFGCGKGETGRVFRRIRPECRYIGVDEDAALLRVARRYLDETFEASPLSMNLAGNGIGGVDCILYRDRALRGLTTECLQAHSGQLAPDGQMVFVLENLGYFPDVMRMIASRTEPFAKSMLTLQSLARLIKNAGLHVVQMLPVYREEDEEEKKRPATRAVLDSFAAWGRKMHFAMDDNNPWACRYILRVVKEPPEKNTFLQAVPGESPLSGRVRIEEPLEFLGTMPGVLCHADRQGADLRPNKEISCRVLILQGRHFRDRASMKKQLAAMRRAGCLIVYETDVLPDHWEDEGGRSRSLDLLGAHVVQVPTEALAEALRPYHPHVKVFRNALRELPPMRNYAGHTPINVFCGTRGEDWRDLLPVLREMSEKYGRRICFRIISRDIFDALEAESKRFIGNEAYHGGRMVPHEVYAAELHRADIVLLPLRDTAQNRVKSDLLFLEAAGHGAAVLAPPIVYGNTIEDGHTGFLYRDFGEFQERFSRLVEEDETRRELAQAAYGYVRRERLLCQCYEERLAFYREMLGQWDVLDREMADRLAK